MQASAELTVAARQLRYKGQQSKQLHQIYKALGLGVAGLSGLALIGSAGAAIPLIVGGLAYGSAVLSENQRTGRLKLLPWVEDDLRSVASRSLNEDIPGVLGEKRHHYLSVEEKALFFLVNYCAPELTKLADRYEDHIFDHVLDNLVERLVETRGDAMNHPELISQGLGTNFLKEALEALPPALVPPQDVAGNLEPAAIPVNAVETEVLDAEDSSSLQEIKPKSKAFSDDPSYSHSPNPFNSNSPATSVVPSAPVTVNDGPLWTHQEEKELLLCKEAGIVPQEFWAIADAMERMGKPRPTPGQIAAALAYAESPVEQGVGAVGKPLETSVGEYFVEPLEASVGKPLEEQDPVQLAKEKVIATVQDFFEKGGKLDVSRLDQNGSNEVKVVRHAAHVGLSLHWLSLQFGINKNTKAYNSLETAFVKHGGKVNR
jgi:hypothetical protein